MLNPNFSRWLLASISAYMKDACDDVELAAIIEGLDDRSKEYMAESDRAEIRISGPFIKPIAGNQYTVISPVNVLITSRYDGEKNAYLIETAVQSIVNAMTAGLEVVKKGSGDDDDPDESIGCLKIDGDVKVFRLGQIQVTEKVKEILIDCKFTGIFDGE